MLDTTIHSVIDDVHQARECFNLSIGADAPLPVVLDSTIGSGFVCKNIKALYTFSCSVHAPDLIWYFNDEIVAAFLPFDRVGDTFVVTYPASAPTYIITMTLIQTASTISFEGYNLPLTTSTLTVQPFNESHIEVIPFTVSCQAHCMDENRTEVCQRKHFYIAGRYYQEHNSYELPEGWRRSVRPHNRCFRRSSFAYIAKNCHIWRVQLH